MILGRFITDRWFRLGLSGKVADSLDYSDLPNDISWIRNDIFQIIAWVIRPMIPSDLLGEIKHYKTYNNVSKLLLYV